MYEYTAVDSRFQAFIADISIVILTVQSSRHKLGGKSE